MDPASAAAAAAAAGGVPGAPLSDVHPNALPPPPRPPGLDAWMATQFPLAFQQHLANVDMHDFSASKHQLPLARIKKIMKSDEDVRMISAEAPVLFAKACELFVVDLTLRAFAYPEHGVQAEGQVPDASAHSSSSPPPKRRTLQRNDIACAIQHSELFDFLHEIMPVLPHNPEEEGTPPHQPDTESGYGAASRRSSGVKSEVILERPLVDPYAESDGAQRSSQSRRRRSPPPSPTQQQQQQQGRSRKRGHGAANGPAASAAASAVHDHRAMADPAFPQSPDIPMPPMRGSDSLGIVHSSGFSPVLSGAYGMTSLSRGESLEHAAAQLSTPNFGAALDLEVAPHSPPDVMAAAAAAHMAVHPNSLSPRLSGHHGGLGGMGVPGPGGLPQRGLSGMMGHSMLVSPGGRSEHMIGAAASGAYGGVPLPRASGPATPGSYSTPNHHLAPHTPNSQIQPWLEGSGPATPAQEATPASQSLHTPGSFGDAHHMQNEPAGKIE